MQEKSKKIKVSKKTSDKKENYYFDAFRVLDSLLLVLRERTKIIYQKKKGERLKITHQKQQQITQKKKKAQKPDQSSILLRPWLCLVLLNMSFSLPRLFFSYQSLLLLKPTMASTYQLEPLSPQHKTPLHGSHHPAISPSAFANYRTKTTSSCSAYGTLNPRQDHCLVRR